MTISDLILHVRYTARMAGNPLGAQATKELNRMLDTAGSSGQFLLFCLRYDFPTEWAAFVNSSADFKATLLRDYFPYAVQGAKKLTVDSLTLYAGNNGKLASVAQSGQAATLSAGLTGGGGSASVSFPPDSTVLVRSAQQQVFLLLQYQFGT